MPPHLFFTRAHFFQDEAGGGRASERPRLVVPVGQPLVDGMLQFGGTSKGSPTNHPLRDQSEPTLHQIKPGAAGRDDMQVESATFLRLEPALDDRTLVGAVVVHDEVKVQLGRYFLFQFREEPAELPAPMAGQAMPNHFVVQDVESGEQGGRPMPLVVVRLTLWRARSQGQNGGGPIQGLDLALFIDAKHQSAIRWIEVKSHYVADLLLELRIVGDLKLLHPMRLQVIALLDAVYHHARNAQVSSEPAHTPAGGVEQSRLRRSIQDLLPQLRGGHPPRPLTRCRGWRRASQPPREKAARVAKIVGRESPVCCAMAWLETPWLASKITRHL